MSELIFRGKTYQMGKGEVTVLALDTIMPSVLPPAWKEMPSPFRQVVPRAYSRAYSATHGLGVIVSACIEADKRRWLHVSISHRGGRLPTWREICEIKDVFCGTERTAYQVHPPQNKHVSIHDACLHLWCPLDGPVTPDFTRGGETI